MKNLLGIHHVSAITARATDNYDFYTNVLGLRLVKKSVNQDDPSVYHLFYADEAGSPGTDLTFFEIPNAAPTHKGTNSISGISLRVPDNHALVYWLERFKIYDVEHEGLKNRYGRQTLAFTDKEGQRLMLVSDETNKGIAGGKPWSKGPVPEEFAIIGLGPVYLTVRKKESTVRYLTEILGFRAKGSYSSNTGIEPDIFVYEIGEGGTGGEVHIEERTDIPMQRLGRGGVHHVALRVSNEEELMHWVRIINEKKIRNSGFVDRYYFKSLYFRDPNGILFELATDGPGFDMDEDQEHLGESLALPPFLESKRAQIETQLKPLNTKRSRGDIQ